MHILYPAIKTNATHQLPVGSGHELYVEECGNPQGIPVLVVHDGPGFGSQESQRRLFDPEHYRIILFDQRGTRHSQPHIELTDNTTEHLIEDIATIRQHLNIERWLICGGGWGACLALCYAQQYPQTVTGLLLHGTLLARRCDIDWLYCKGANQVFPDHWDAFCQSLNETEKNNPLKTYTQRLHKENELTRMSAAKTWSRWYAHCSSLQPRSTITDYFSDPRLALPFSMIATHYLEHDYFLSDNHILKHIDTIKSIPSIIIHGRYDMISPLSAAWALHQACPSSILHIVRDAGHSIQEPNIIDAVISAGQDFARDLEK